MAAPHDPPRVRRRGRRSGGDDTRSALLDAARAAFAERGYDGATVRHIAERAGVDAAMVNHWFGGKEALFTASLHIPFDPAVVMPEVLAGDHEQLGERLVHRFLTTWDATGGAPLASVIRSVASHEAAARMLREFVTRVILARIVGVVAPDRPELRAALVGSQLIGMGLVRYVVKLEPLASADRATVVAAVAPTVQRYLTGPIDPS
ncbi:TetR family transcriptional regulator [Pseudonocardia broussonetiae]|uniref:TetR/AcrR family transcriptional regulator n=1 Tax=Pseudonocardia broussonetiae TaxID=2736640 RepID=A0A6M6JR65_9PSEU|nr:TetR family transcriptional regulator [Pseudonocardia broussonetiae]QJY49487.1 TetR/AcrR family transcriptional regulator [Pseudonocardia broussonetiae]